MKDDSAALDEPEVDPATATGDSPVASVFGSGAANDPLFEAEDEFEPLHGLHIEDDEDDDDDAVLNSLAPEFWDGLKEARFEPHPDDGEPGAATMTADMAGMSALADVEEEPDRSPRPLAFWITALASDAKAAERFPELGEVLVDAPTEADVMDPARRGARALARVASRLNAKMVHLHRDPDSLQAMALAIYFQAKHALHTPPGRIEASGLRQLMASRPVARAVLDALAGQKGEWVDPSRSRLEQALVMLNAALPDESSKKPAPPVASPPPAPPSAVETLAGPANKVALAAAALVLVVAGAYWIPILLQSAPEPPPDSVFQSVIVEVRAVQLNGETLELVVKESWAKRDGWARMQELERLLEVSGSYIYEEIHLSTPSGRNLVRMTVDGDMYWGEGVDVPS